MLRRPTAPTFIFFSFFPRIDFRLAVAALFYIYFYVFYIVYGLGIMYEIPPPAGRVDDVKCRLTLLYIWPTSISDSSRRRQRSTIAKKGIQTRVDLLRCCRGTGRSVHKTCWNITDNIPPSPDIYNVHTHTSVAI